LVLSRYSFHYISDAIIVTKDVDVSEEKVENMILMSRTDDLSDIAGVFSPSSSMLKKGNFTRPASEFIDTCSMNGKHCSHK